MPKTLLAVYAHPDDEGFSGGALAHYAAKGYRVVLACATRGEAGQVKDASLGQVKDLGALREQELRKACEILGIEPPVFLGFHDSGRKERVQQDNPLALMNAGWLEVEARVREVIARVEPQVILTFDPHGGYGHVDHLVVQRATTAAFFSSSHLPNPPQRLFYGVLPLASLERMRQSERFANLLGENDPKVFGVDPRLVAVRLNVEPYLERKWQANRAHVSQFASVSNPPDPEFVALMREIQTHEHYALGAARGPIPRWPMEDLFEGLE
ncbi:PIG-L deacetylase family protein [Calidithermus chliarophilus]|uniref:PIG-L deacetylase family protein n=1 Tax=Calidithermus chliarophilus TaxID=52023 RepID=UPI000421A30D|nr:PIG-L deacetylase family protein [Calidithermus chliarophilus]